MSKLKCPFCQQELDTGSYYVHCHNPHCNTTAEMEGTEEMWQELIRTRKALEIAVDALKRIKFRGEHSKYECCKVSGNIAKQALEQITALEQKDHFADVSKMIEQKDAK